VNDGRCCISRYGNCVAIAERDYGHKRQSYVQNSIGKPPIHSNTQLVSDCSKVHCLNFVARYRYDVKLKAFTKSFRNIYSTVMLAQIARDQKENRRSQILLAYNNPAQSHKILRIVDIY